MDNHTEAIDYNGAVIQVGNKVKAIRNIPYNTCGNPCGKGDRIKKGEVCTVDELREMGGEPTVGLKEHNFLYCSWTSQDFAIVPDNTQKKR